MDKNEKLIAVIGTEDTVTGFLLAGIGSCGKEKESNFYIVKPDTTKEAIEEKFHSFTERDDIAIVLINQHIAEKIRYAVDAYSKNIPCVLEIPSKDVRYDPSKDSILVKAKELFQGES
ncbi:probable V-type proton ATPase subunit F [Zophobas morio]|uniref:probable V-type proton ATPase subunit F n=1 Tax=Zophobas morio TaxID=2755281 RepID=UPI003083EA07